MFESYLTPKEAAAELGISRATICRCVKMGAPVHRWGSTGTRYRIAPGEFVAWMESRGTERTSSDGPRRALQMAVDADELARRRRALVNG